jgi:hypothetical protein
MEVIVWNLKFLKDFTKETEHYASANLLRLKLLKRSTAVTIYLTLI